MNKNNKTEGSKNRYDDGNIPEVDLLESTNKTVPAEPLPESSRPRKDRSGGE